MSYSFKSSTSKTVAFIVVVSSLLAACDSNKTSWAIDEVRPCADYTFPLVTKEDAVAYACEQGLSKGVDFEALKKSGWDKFVVSVIQQKEPHWTVSLKSQGVLPSYGCFISFDSQGVIVASQPCQYNK